MAAHVMCCDMSQVHLEINPFSKASKNSMVVENLHNFKDSDTSRLALYNIFGKHKMWFVKPSLLSITF